MYYYGTARALGRWRAYVFTGTRLQAQTLLGKVVRVLGAQRGGGLDRAARADAAITGLAVLTEPAAAPIVQKLQRSMVGYSGLRTMPETEHLLQDTKGGVSPARLAAESAFAAMPTPPPTDSVPVVIRRRKIVIGDEGSTELHHSAGDDGSARAPKIFRVEPRHDAEVTAAVDPDAAATLASWDASQTRDDGRNRRRRQQARRRGSVTIIRPEPPSSSELAERRREAEERYDLLMAEVRALDIQIETARKAEVAKAVRWIRKAIADYDFQAEDLGF